MQLSALHEKAGADEIVREMAGVVAQRLGPEPSSSDR